MPAMPGRQRGFLREEGPDGTIEHETFTCCHCNRLQVVPHRARPEDAGGFCMRCMQMTCFGCARSGHCTPFEEKIARYEQKQRMLAQIVG